MIGSIYEQHYQGNDAATLRGLVDGFWADVLPQDVARPYVVVEEAGTTLREQSKANNRPTVRRVTVSFTALTRNRPEAEAILDECERVFLNAANPLTLDDAQHLATRFKDRRHGFEYGTDNGGWIGILELEYEIRK